MYVDTLSSLTVTEVRFNSYSYVGACCITDTTYPHTSSVFEGTAIANHDPATSRMSPIKDE